MLSEPATFPETYSMLSDPSTFPVTHTHYQWPIYNLSDPNDYGNNLIIDLTILLGMKQLLQNVYKRCEKAWRC